MSVNTCPKVAVRLMRPSEAGPGTSAEGATTGHLQWSVPFAVGTLQAKATKAGMVAATDTVKTAGAAAKVTLSADRASIAADGRDLVYVEVDVVDAQGGVVPRANNTISVAVSGAGTLVGLDAGDSTDHDSYKRTSHVAYNGKLVAIIRSTTTAGILTVNATPGTGGPALTLGCASIVTQAP